MDDQSKDAKVDEAPPEPPYIGRTLFPPVFVDKRDQWILLTAYAVCVVIGVVVIVFVSPR